MKTRNPNLSLWNALACIAARKLFPAFSLLGLFFTASQYTQAQCNTAVLKWNHMDYYYNSGTGAPYGRGSASIAYISDAMEQTQKFAIGKSWVSINTSSNAMVTTTENNTHTADGGSYGTGDDVQYEGNGTITFTFGVAVQNVKFSIYDVDRSQRIQFAAADGATARSISLSKVSGSILSFNNNNSTTARVDATNSTVANTSTDGTVNVDIAGPVTSITLTISNTATCTSSCGGGGTEATAVYWLSDITACVPGSFPTDYHKIAGSKPFTGVGGVNQPDYFIATPDNDAVYMVDPATGNAKFLFRDQSKDYVNSFAYDAVNHILYYISEDPTANQANKTLKKYDFNTNTSSVVVADIVTTLGIPTFNLGIESAGAAWYDGALYLGIEGGQHNSGNTTRESIIWRIDFNTSLVPVSAYQVWATPSYDADGSPSFHDWGDFVIKDGMIINFNTARSGNGPYNYAQSKFHHYNMMTGVEQVFTNPTTLPYAGQGGLTWNGDLYWLRDSVAKYNMDGTYDATTKKKLVVVAGSGPYATWSGGTGDASDPFRPKSDFGDAPASYDGAGDPAVHDYDANLLLGTSFDDEWSKTGSTSLANSDGSDEDCLAFVPIFTHHQGDYDVDIKVTNKTGAAARVVAWIDFNNNGTFEASEGIVVTVNSSASVQNVHLAWGSQPTINAAVSNVYMRIRVASGTTMTTSTPNNWFPNGEVEDYQVMVDDVLPVKLKDFSAKGVDNKYVDVNWNSSDEKNMKEFVLERSRDGMNWEQVTTVAAKGNAGETSYNYHDQSPLPGTSYYRLLMHDLDDRGMYSDAKKVSLNMVIAMSQVSPNPFSDIISINITLLKKETVRMRIIDQSGNIVRQKRINAQEGPNAVKLDNVGTLPAGFYILEIITSGEVKREKLLKK